MEKVLLMKYYCFTFFVRIISRNKHRYLFHNEFKKWVIRSNFEHFANNRTKFASLDNSNNNYYPLQNILTQHS